MISMATYFREHFRARIYLTFSALIVMISIAFTFFFFRYQSSCVVKEMVGKGELITGLFANTARLGTFSENPEQLRGPLDDIMKNGEVVSVAVFTADGRLLAFRNRSGGTVPTRPFLLPSSRNCRRRPLLRSISGRLEISPSFTVCLSVRQLSRERAVRQGSVNGRNSRSASSGWCSMTAS
jgi:hypothetical protein